MSTITLKISPRDSEVKAEDIRRDGNVPCILYGHKTKNQQIQCDYQEFHKTYVAAGESTVIELDLDGKKTSVLIHALDFDPVTDLYRHIDFFVPDMTKEVTTHVPIRTFGESPGVKEQGGILIHNRDSISVKCLPKDLPHEVAVDLSVLKEHHDSVTVGDLTLPETVNIQEDPQTLLVSVMPPRKEEEKIVATTEESAEGEEDKDGEEKKEETTEDKKDEGKK